VFFPKARDQVSHRYSTPGKITVYVSLSYKRSKYVNIGHFLIFRFLDRTCEQNYSEINGSNNNKHFPNWICSFYFYHEYIILVY
jgi:hypothetical protein